MNKPSEDPATREQLQCDHRHQVIYFTYYSCICSLSFAEKKNMMLILLEKC